MSALHTRGHVSRGDILSEGIMYVESATISTSPAFPLEGHLWEHSRVAELVRSRPWPVIVSNAYSYVKEAALRSAAS